MIAQYETKSQNLSMPESSSKNSKNLVQEPAKMASGGAALVALGIMFSRVMGLIRQKIFAYFFGNSDLGDAFYAALKIPNFLQNLLGDGVLSASLIPVYANLQAQGKSRQADQVAGIVGSLLAMTNIVVVGLGILATPQLIDLIAPGFEGEKKQLTIFLVQIFFPGTGFLVMSAWCLGILNSHRKFFLSYAAPVMWNLVIILSLVMFGTDLFGLKQNPQTLVVYTSWGVLLGSFLQFLIQVPVVLRCAPDLKWSLDLSLQPVKQVLKSFVPVVTSRGVVQLSAYIDNILASFLPGGAVSALAYAQSLYMLPISLFGMSVSAAELPTMSGALGSDTEISEYLKKRMQQGLQQIAFFVVPSVIGFLAAGDVIVRALYRGGEFDEVGVNYVWAVLVGSSIGLVSTTMGRLYSSAFYSLKDTKTPLKYAVIRVVFTSLLGWVAGLYLPAFLGLEASWGTSGLTATAGISGWIEFLLLRRALRKKIGDIHFIKGFLPKLWLCAILSGIVVWFAKSILINHIFLNLVIVLALFGLIYFASTAIFGIQHSKYYINKVLKL